MTFSRVNFTVYSDYIARWEVERIGFRFPYRPASCRIGTGGRGVAFCPRGGGVRSRREINLTTLPSRAEFKNAWSYTYADPRLFMIRRFINSGQVELFVSESRNTRIVMRSETVFGI